MQFRVWPRWLQDMHEFYHTACCYVLGSHRSDALVSRLSLLAPYNAASLELYLLAAKQLGK